MKCPNCRSDDNGSRYATPGSTNILHWICAPCYVSVLIKENERLRQGLQEIKSNIVRFESAKATPVFKLETIERINIIVRRLLTPPIEEGNDASSK
jgi:hypothetical protein